ncbi:MAG: thiopeptide-type bacteriocin biosynthesis protein [Saprospiraceae bacterium]|nr:thiopeptide-type bacteriocin biosynthesis protein [Saprospiraceae bacterium]
MSWLSIHFYPLENQEVFLVRGLRPFLQQYIWATRGARAFFIRYQDEKGPHLRIRMRGEEAWMEETLRPAFSGWMEGRGEWQEQPYEPETARFGGEEALAMAESYFHLSSRVVLDRLAREMYTYGDAMFDALRMHVIAVHAAGLKQKEAAKYFDRLTLQWLPLFFGDANGLSPEDQAALLNNFSETLAPQQDGLSDTLQELWKALDRDKFDKEQPEWARWAEGNRLIFKEYGPKLEMALPSLLHLTNNRLGLQNPDEVYVNYILSKTVDG